jgi:uncharacterized oligopeptide transporter (OPT) family protein
VKLVPSGVSFALGIFIAPAFTLPRVAGGVCALLLNSVLSVPQSTIEVIGSGLIVGESVGTLSYFVLLESIKRTNFNSCEFIKLVY